MQKDANKGRKGEEIRYNTKYEKFNEPEVKNRNYDKSGPFDTSMNGPVGQSSTSNEPIVHVR
jgi:hypothetical protein